MPTTSQRSPSGYFGFLFFIIKQRLAEALAVAWEVETDGLKEVRGINSNLDEDVQRLDGGLVNRY